MEKEKVTEELVRQNGNQAAAVMADFTAQGGGEGGDSSWDLPETGKYVLIDSGSSRLTVIEDSAVSKNYDGLSNTYQVVSAIDIPTSQVVKQDYRTELSINVQSQAEADELVELLKKTVSFMHNYSQKSAKAVTFVPPTSESTTYSFTFMLNSLFYNVNITVL